MKNINLIIALCLSHIFINAQVTLNADGPGNTYELITSVLAPGYNPIEVPDCNHSDFGRHIDEIFDTELNKNVFRFIIHTTPDNDRCINFDRQRNEIKSYDQSPDNLLGIENEIVIYTWKFKLDANFQVSSNFTHLHQLKSVGGNFASMPMYTLTARKSTPDRIELRYAETDSQITLLQTDLAPFKGHWVNVTETITYGASGTYSILIKKESDDSVLLDYSNNSIINWRPYATFVRPKWGIYRSLNSVSDLTDEEVLFSDFGIEEVSNLSLSEINKGKVSIYPNPVLNELNFKLKENTTFDKIEIYNNQAKLIRSYDEELPNASIDLSSLETGLYFILFKNKVTTITSKKFIIK